jgi:hypothetical protein
VTVEPAFTDVPAGGSTLRTAPTGTVGEYCSVGSTTALSPRVLSVDCAVATGVPTRPVGIVTVAGVGVGVGVGVGLGVGVGVGLGVAVGVGVGVGVGDAAGVDLGFDGFGALPWSAGAGGASSESAGPVGTV